MTREQQGRILRGTTAAAAPSFEEDHLPARLMRFQRHGLFRLRLLEGLAGDLRYTLREMRRSAGFTSVAVVSLALGIGATTAAFAVLDAFMLRGLPVRDPQRLVAFSLGNSPRWATWPHAAYARWQSSPERPFDAAAASDARSYDVPPPGSRSPVSVRASLVSPNYFQVMGVDVTLGQSFASQDGATSDGGVAVISHAFWERWFGGAPDVLGRTIHLQDRSFEVIGVARRGFTGHVVGHPADMWVPLTMQEALLPGARLLEDRWGTGAQWLRIVARLADGASLEQAAAAAELIRRRFVDDKATALGENAPAVQRDRKQTLSLLRATNGYGPERARYGRPMMILFAITALVLLVACANFTNLMVARAADRHREFAIRLALGGGQWRLFRQSATECATLAVLAGALGLVLAKWAAVISVRQFVAMIAPIEFGFGLDVRVLGFVVGCIVLVIAFGLWPCTRAVRSTAPAAVYHSAAPPIRHGALAGRAMLVGQLAMCTIVLIGAGLLLRTVTNLRTQDLGFDRQVLLVPVSPGQAGYTGDAATMLVERLRERLSAVPGILAVGISGASLLDSNHYWIDGSERLTTDVGAALTGGRWTSAAVGPGFFEAVGMPLIHGQGFDDRLTGPQADGVVINQSLARILFGTENPAGRKLRMNPSAPLQPVIGVVRDATQTSPRESQRRRRLPPAGRVRAHRPRRPDGRPPG